MFAFLVLPIVEVTLRKLRGFDNVFSRQDANGVKKLTGINFRQVFEIELVEQIISNKHRHVTNARPSGQHHRRLEFRFSIKFNEFFH